jgi:signal recognition particle subunit SEC65
MMNFTAILINIEGLNDDAASKIANTFVDNLGQVRHNDGMAFYRDLQPVCREQNCKATLVDGVRAEIYDGADDEKCEINLVSMSGDDKEFNALLVLKKTREVYSIAQFFVFVPNEVVNSMNNCHINVEMTMQEPSEEEIEKASKKCDYNCNSCEREDCKWSKANGFGKPAEEVDVEFTSTVVENEEVDKAAEEIKEKFAELAAKEVEEDEVNDQSPADAESDN